MSTPQQPSPARHALSEHLRLVSAGQIEAWVDLYTPDGVIEFPFAPTGVPTRVQGREALLAHMRSFPETFDVRFVDLVFHDLTDPHTAIAEFRSTGSVIPTGKPYEQTVVAVVHTDSAGRIERFVDYWNPLVAIEALTHDEQPAAQSPAANG